MVRTFSAQARAQYRSTLQECTRVQEYKDTKVRKSLESSRVKNHAKVKIKYFMLLLLLLLLLFAAAVAIVAVVGGRGYILPYHTIHYPTIHYPTSELT